jgi:hypothetical protein
MTSEDDIRPQPGPQSMAAKSKARILVYGGGAGGGKSWLAAWRAAKYVGIKGYNAAIFRRTFTMLEGSGSIIDETSDMYPLLGGRMTQRPLEWRFPPHLTRGVPPSPARGQCERAQVQAVRVHNSDEASDFVGGQFFHELGCAPCPGCRNSFFVDEPRPGLLLTKPARLVDRRRRFPRRERCGKIRFWVRVKDEIVWADSVEAPVKYVDNDPDSVMSMTFIPAFVHDNRKL